MTHPEAEWRIDEGNFPDNASAEERMRFLLGYAILAPSGHNTQPWLFRLIPGGVELLADRTRCLPVVDPFDRALVISCGAALGHLRAAIRFFGNEPEVKLLPETTEPDLLARVTFGGKVVPTAQDIARFHAITRRRTTRVRYPDEPLPDGLEADLTAAARLDRCELAIVTDPERKTEIAQLVAEGDRAQFGNPSFRRELGAWIHSRRSKSRDGMSGAAFGMPDLLSSVGGLVVRTFDMGDGQAARDEAVATGSPALIMLASSNDEPDDWLHAGMALSSILLTVTAAGWTSAYLNQPVETDELRLRLRDTVELSGHPQLLFRIGRAALISPSVRRSVSDVLEDGRIC